MKNQGFIAFVFAFTIFIGGAFLINNAAPAQAYHDGGYYDDYGYGYDGYGYGYDDYGYGYGYDDCDYGYCGSDYGYGYDYGYDYDDCYGCGGYDYYDYGCGYDCYDYPEYDDCYYGYCGNYDYPDYDYCYSCDDEDEEPIQINNTNTNTNVSNNNNNNVNNNHIVIRNFVGGESEPIRERERVYERDRDRDYDEVVCTPASQSVGINEYASLHVSGGNGNYSWSAPGSQNLAGRGDRVELRYPSSGLKTIVVSSAGDSATCFVQVTGGQVLAEFIEFPNTGEGGVRAILPNMIAIGGAVLAGIFGLVFAVRRAMIA